MTFHAPFSAISLSQLKQEVIRVAARVYGDISSTITDETTVDGVKRFIVRVELSSNGFILAGTSKSIDYNTALYIAWNQLYQSLRSGMLDGNWLQQAESTPILEKMLAAHAMTREIESEHLDGGVIRVRCRIGDDVDKTAYGRVYSTTLAEADKLCIKAWQEIQDAKGDGVSTVRNLNAGGFEFNTLL